MNNVVAEDGGENVASLEFASCKDAHDNVDENETCVSCAALDCIHFLAWYARLPFVVFLTNVSTRIQ